MHDCTEMECPCLCLLRAICTLCTCLLCLCAWISCSVPQKLFYCVNNLSWNKDLVLNMCFPCVPAFGFSPLCSVASVQCPPSYSEFTAFVFSVHHLPALCWCFVGDGMCWCFVGDGITIYYTPVKQNMVCQVSMQRRQKLPKSETYIQTPPDQACSTGTWGWGKTRQQDSSGALLSPPTTTHCHLPSQQHFGGELCQWHECGNEWLQARVDC